MMKYSTLFLLVVTILSCTERKDTFIPEKFEIETTTVEFPHVVHDIIQFENGFIVNVQGFTFGADRNIAYLDKSFQLDTVKTKQLNKGLNYVDAIWTSGDTLYLTEKAFTVKYWKNNTWNFFKTIPREEVRNESRELNYPIYEDDEFIVRSCCMGEWGGAIYFKDKKSGKTYSCQATCLKFIQKLNGSFYVTSSLPHMEGFSQVLKIDNPRELYEIQTKEQLKNCGWYDIYSDKGNKITHPTGYDKGYEILLDTIGVNILGSFAYKNHIYHIYTDMKWNTYLGYIENKKPIAIDTIIKGKVALFSRVRDLKHNPNIFPIMSRDLNGVILVKDKKVKLVEFKLSKDNVD